MTYGHYQPLEILGKGGMGVVYTAQDLRQPDLLVALKCLRREISVSPSFKARFIHEGELAKRLSHPHLVRTLDVGKTADSHYYIACELVFGIDLRRVTRRFLEQRRQAPVEIAIRVLVDVLDALSYVHNATDRDGVPLSLVHRDISPGNIMIGFDGIVRLADLGAAKSCLTEPLALTHQGTIVGTPNYIAPEIVMGQEATPASDIYSLSMVLYQLLTGRAPYSGNVREVLYQLTTKRPKPLAEHRPDVPSWLLGLLERMMRRNPKERPHEARSLRAMVIQHAQRHDQMISIKGLARRICSRFQAEVAKKKRNYESLITHAYSPVFNQAAPRRSPTLFNDTAFEIVVGAPPSAAEVSTRRETHADDPEPPEEPVPIDIDDDALHAPTIKEHAQESVFSLPRLVPLKGDPSDSGFVSICPPVPASSSPVCQEPTAPRAQCFQTPSAYGPPLSKIGAQSEALGAVLLGFMVALLVFSVGVALVVVTRSGASLPLTRTSVFTGLLVLTLTFPASLGLGILVLGRR